MQDAQAERPEEESVPGTVEVAVNVSKEIAEKIEALATLRSHTPAEELNFAASFWIQKHKIQLNGGEILFKTKRGRKEPLNPLKTVLKEEALIDLKIDMVPEVVELIRALAKINYATLDEELNSAMSFWLQIFEIQQNGGQVLLKLKDGRIGPFDFEYPKTVQDELSF